MAEEKLNYYVTAFIQAKGNIGKQMLAMSGAVRPASKAMVGLGTNTVAAGRLIQGQSGMIVSSIARIGTAVGALAAGFGLGALIKTGIDFNVMLSNTRSQIVGAFQLFERNNKALGEGTTLAQQLAANISNAEYAMQELIIIADAVPGEIEDVNKIFASMVPTMTSITGDLDRMLGLTEAIALATPALGGNFTVVGQQMARIVSGAAEQQAMAWRTLKEPIGALMRDSEKFSAKIGDTAGAKAMVKEIHKLKGKIGDSNKMVEKFNKLVPATRLALVEAALKPFSERDIRKFYEEQWDALVGTAKSRMKQLAGGFTKPLFEDWKKFLLDMVSDGPFSKENFSKLRTAAGVYGSIFFGGATRVFNSLRDGIDYVANNTEGIANQIYGAFQTGALVVKLILGSVLTRMFVGAAVTAAGRITQMFGKVGGAGAMFGRAAMKLTPRRRRMGGAKAALEAKELMFTGLLKPLQIARRQTLGVNRFAAAWGAVAVQAGITNKRFIAMGGALIGMVPTMITMGIAAGIIGVALGGVVVIMAGVAAFLIENWASISQSIITNMNDGKSAIQGTVIAGMKLWIGLVAVGEAILGASGGVGLFNAGLGFLAGTFNAVAGGISIILMIGKVFVLWIGGVRLLVAKLFKGLASMAGAIPGLSGFAKNVGLLSEAFNESSRDAGNLALKLEKAQKAFDTARMKGLDTEAIERKTKEWQQKIENALTPGKGGRKPVVPRGPEVKIGKVVVNMDLRNEDPDRLMPAFMRPLERLAEQRTQSFELVDEGI